ncbi:MAG TPA: 4Fe-4S binding protein [Candidatus Borkfalkia excrementavium]|uniref:4Fe-4S binding protein n=1 Tax=Candidatus Borkfalkia excrementavium TaxID=2838505 RepID=A0A9D1Z6M9_9FIRM|nr:4Fe-4S binding protein [Candidatus Borkfalkia excrementavium]
MIRYLDFKDARCKDCYKCLRECPVKAIKVVDHHAKIIESRCILCGHCTKVCPQNAKSVHTERAEVEKLLSAGKVIASVAPSFVSSFDLQDFSVMKLALGRLGFADAEETSVGAREVTAQYKKLLEGGTFKNFITSCCPAVNTMIELYYPKALQYLAPVDTPMIAHAKMIRKAHPDAKVVFIGPCIAKKREAVESGVVDGVLTFEDLSAMFEDKGIVLSEIAHIPLKKAGSVNRAKYYPISRGIIKSFENYIDGYEFVAVDGAEKCKEVLENIDSLSGMFIEMNSCDSACVNGPCSLALKAGALKANADIRKYVNKDLTEHASAAYEPEKDIDFTCVHERKRTEDFVPTDRQINEILAKTGKTKPEDMLNCGACGYNTCYEKAWAVANGYANIDMCVPFMRERAESMSYEIIQTSPNGIVLLDTDLNILEINGKAKELLGIKEYDVKGKGIFHYFNPTDFVLAVNDNKNVYNKKVYLEKTGCYIELTIIVLKDNKGTYAVMKDITQETKSEEQLSKVKLETLATTDEVIKKQMRVAQEIASLLGETTAETKVALLKLKKTLQDGGEK